MFNPTTLLIVSFWGLVTLSIPSFAHPSPANLTSILEARENRCICEEEGRFCIGFNERLSGICPADTIITCKAENIGKEPAKKQYCNNGRGWRAKEDSHCYWKQLTKDSGKLACK
ncbi:hypothetical protein ONS95_000354 [Cadophora gregata]|uniref:uncharacterized protein n=1 Tax=Cadophora gregata TaxID=51156 RepID=UPI0026DC675F|nr:uncharacterized protein ONS95_000354 [Cadophora gregata]KAK0128384.1 hypothetical protein ONS95_000354 [Cadophora gregata]